LIAVYVVARLGLCLGLHVSHAPLDSPPRVDQRTIFRNQQAIKAIVGTTLPQVSNALDSLGKLLTKNVPTPHAKCQWLFHKNLTTSEDIALWKDGVVLVGSGETVAQLWIGDFSGPQGIFAYAPGKVFSVDLKQSSPALTEVPIEGIPEGISFHPHGIYLSNASSRLYTVSHGLGGGGDRVIIFDIVEGTPTKLKYVRSITGRGLWGNVQLNDVVEGRTKHEMYISIS